MNVRPDMLMFLIALLGAACAVGCDEDRGMYRQQKKGPLEASDFFEDGGMARHPPPGTVAAVEVKDWFDRRTRIEMEGDVGQFVPQGQSESLPPMDELRLGQTQFNIWCAPCHGQAGTGDGMVVRRGYPRPPSYHIPRLRNANDAHFVRVIEEGWGKMPAYGNHVSTRERDAIIAYIRALQLSQYAPVDALSAELREQLMNETPATGGQREGGASP